MNPARRNFTIWLLCSGGVSLLSYVFAEYLLLPGVLQLAALFIGALASTYTRDKSYKSIAGGSALGFFMALLGILVIGRFNHAGDRSIFATFLVINFGMFLIGALLSAKRLGRANESRDVGS